MQEEAAERVRFAVTKYDELVQQATAVVNAIEAAIAQTDLGKEQLNEARQATILAFNTSGGISGDNNEIGKAEQRMARMFDNMRSMLGSARLIANQITPVAQSNADSYSTILGYFDR